MKRSSTTPPADVLSEFTTSTKIYFQEEEIIIPQLELSSTLLRSMTPLVLAKLNTIIELLDEYAITTKDYPMLHQEECMAAETGSTSRTCTHILETYLRL